MAPLGSLRLGLVVVHVKMVAGGNRGNGCDKTVLTTVEVVWQWAENGAAAVNRWRRRSAVAADEVSGSHGNGSGGGGHGRVGF